MTNNRKISAAGFPLTLNLCKLKLRTENKLNANTSISNKLFCILQKFHFFFFFAILSVRTGSLGHGVRGATRGPSAPHNSSKVDRVILSFGATVLWNHKWSPPRIPPAWPLPRKKKKRLAPITRFIAFDYQFLSAVAVGINLPKFGTPTAMLFGTQEEKTCFVFFVV